MMNLSRGKQGRELQSGGCSIRNLSRGKQGGELEGRMLTRRHKRGIGPDHSKGRWTVSR